MSFLYPYVLIALALPVILGVGAYLLHLHRKGNWEKLVSPAHRKELVRTTSPLHSVIPLILALSALACCIIAAARPFNGYKNTEALVTGRNLIIALDISRSMETQDVSPSRLEEARTAARVLIDALPTDKIGLILFSGEAELLIPLTYDHLTLQETLNLVNRDWESYGGSNLEHVLKLAMQSFERAAATGTNALVILSDGEDTMNFSPALLEEARKKNLMVITVGIGTTEGATIPDTERENGMWQDAEGKHVISKLQPETLSMLARETGGDFFIMNNSTDLTAFAHTAAEKIDRHEEAQSAGKAPNDMYEYFAVAALLLAVAAILLATRWRRMPTNLTRKAGILILMALVPGQLQAAPQKESHNAYKQALNYQKEGKTEECAVELSKALLDEDTHMQAAALQRLGNINMEQHFDELRKLYTPSAQGQPA
ncbi:MAG: VWA domain-containing protein, partial [Akkermansia sp.]|nr:VWA domain-containing protein [Akkermansia sp.]